MLSIIGGYTKMPKIIHILIIILIMKALNTRSQKTFPERNIRHNFQTSPASGQHVPSRVADIKHADVIHHEIDTLNQKQRLPLSKHSNEMLQELRHFNSKDRGLVRNQQKQLPNRPVFPGLEVPEIITPPGRVMQYPFRFASVNNKQKQRGNRPAFPGLKIPEKITSPGILMQNPFQYLSVSDLQRLLRLIQAKIKKLELEMQPSFRQQQRLPRKPLPIANFPIHKQTLSAKPVSQIQKYQRPVFTKNLLKTKHFQNRPKENFLEQPRIVIQGPSRPALAPVMHQPKQIYIQKPLKQKERFYSGNFFVGSTNEIGNIGITEKKQKIRQPIESKHITLAKIQNQIYPQFQELGKNNALSTGTFVSNSKGITDKSKNQESKKSQESVESKLLTFPNTINEKGPLSIHPGNNVRTSPTSKPSVQISKPKCSCETLLHNAEEKRLTLQEMTAKVASFLFSKVSALARSSTDISLYGDYKHFITNTTTQSTVATAEMEEERRAEKHKRQHFPLIQVIKKLSKKSDREIVRSLVKLAKMTPVALTQEYKDIVFLIDSCSDTSVALDAIFNSYIASENSHVRALYDIMRPIMIQNVHISLDMSQSTEIRRASLRVILWLWISLQEVRDMNMSTYGTNSDGETSQLGQAVNTAQSISDSVSGSSDNSMLESGENSVSDVGENSVSDLGDNSLLSSKENSATDSRDNSISDSGDNSGEISINNSNLGLDDNSDSGLSDNSISDLGDNVGENSSENSKLGLDDKSDSGLGDGQVKITESSDIHTLKTE